MAFIAMGCVLIVIFGLVDDLFELKPILKVAGQTLGILSAMKGGVVIATIPFLGLDAAPVWLSYPLTYCFILGVINGVNFSDGLDGLAAGTSLIALGTIAILGFIIGHDQVALIALTVIGGVLGFLRYNTHPARIFMGDSGSQFLGFVTACLAIMVTQSESSALSPMLPVLLLGLPILDIIQVIPVRIRKKLPLPGPDKEHFHHQINKLGFLHHEVVAIIYILQVILMLMAFVFRFANDAVLLSIYISFGGVLLGALLLLHKKQWRAHGSILSKTIDERRNHFLRNMNWLYFRTGIIVEYAIVLFFIIALVTINSVRADFAVTAIIVSLLIIAMWRFSPVNNVFIARACCYCTSVFVVYFLSQVQSDGPLMSLLDGYLIALAVFLMLGIRMTRRDRFRLDNQDLLILLLIIIVPQLPFESIDKYSVDKIALQLAALMYACEFAVAKDSTKLNVLGGGSALSLLAIGCISLL
jgi:UDP-GlcNAc:undecaprenyl-phosphate GlcNAc-1-phosphate transferase